MIVKAQKRLERIEELKKKIATDNSISEAEKQELHEEILVEEEISGKPDKLCTLGSPRNKEFLRRNSDFIIEYLFNHEIKLLGRIYWELIEKKAIERVTMEQ